MDNKEKAGIGSEKSTILSKLELCMKSLNNIHCRVNIIRELVLGEGASLGVPTVESTSIEGVVNVLFDNIINLHEKVDIIHEKL